jgi:hypothetical protein
MSELQLTPTEPVSSQVQKTINETLKASLDRLKLSLNDMHQLINLLDLGDEVDEDSTYEEMEEMIIENLIVGHKYMRQILMVIEKMNFWQSDDLGQWRFLTKIMVIVFVLDRVFKYLNQNFQSSKIQKRRALHMKRYEHLMLLLRWCWVLSGSFSVLYVMIKSLKKQSVNRRFLLDFLKENKQEIKTSTEDSADSISSIEKYLHMEREKKLWQSLIDETAESTTKDNYRLEQQKSLKSQNIAQVIDKLNNFHEQFQQEIKNPGQSVNDTTEVTPSRQTVQQKKQKILHDLIQELKWRQNHSRATSEKLSEQSSLFYRVMLIVMGILGYSPEFEIDAFTDLYSKTHRMIVGFLKS